MNRLKSQRLKRARRQALHEARRLNRTYWSKEIDKPVVFLTRIGNNYRRKWMWKRNVLRLDIGISLVHAVSKAPTDERRWDLLIDHGEISGGSWARPVFIKNADVTIGIVRKWTQVDGRKVELCNGYEVVEPPWLTR